MNVMAVTGMTALSIGKGIALQNAEELEATLRHIGATRYHNLHPFHGRMDAGELTRALATGALEILGDLGERSRAEQQAHRAPASR